MNLHNLIAGRNITNSELEEKVSRMIGNALLGSVALNVIFIMIACNKYEQK